MINKDFGSKSDPVIKVFQKNYGTHKWDFIDQTEIIDDTLSPEFHKSVKVEYHFEEQQELLFTVLDVFTYFNVNTSNINTNS